MKKWKFIFGIAALLFAIDLIQLPFRAQLEFSNFIAVIIGGLSLIPLYGYAYQIAIGNKPIAIAIFAVNVLISLAVLVTSAMPYFGNFGLGAILSIVCGVLFLAVFLYPQFMYAFRSNPIWGENA